MPRVEREKRELLLRQEGQEYALVIKMLGGGRLEGKCLDGIVRLCKIRGKMMKGGKRMGTWIRVGDIILISTRDYQDNKADVIYKYTPDEIRKLNQLGQLPFDVEKPKDGDGKEKEEESVVFEDI
jgi:translation initiation factor 1A